MEQKYDLNPSRKKGAKDLRRTGKTASKRWTAILLSVILAAGNCIPAMAAEASGTQGVDSGITAEEYEQDAAAASEEQDAGEETEQMPSEEAPENDEGPDADEKKDADEGSDASSEDQAGEESVDGYTTDESEIAAAETEVSESDEEGGLTDEAEDENADADRSEDITELEEPVETEGVSKEALAQADASLSDYDYSFSSVGGTEVVKLDYYNGSETNISVPGTVTVDGDSYYVSADSAYVWHSVDLESITFGSGFIFPEYSDQFFTACADTLESVDMRNADLTNVSSLYEMFRNCSSLTNVSFGNDNGPYIDDTSYMFAGCSAIEEIDLHILGGCPIDNADSMFEGCSSLRTVNLSGINMNGAVNSLHLNRFFYGCTSLEEIITPVISAYHEETGIILPRCFEDEAGNLYSSILYDFTSSRTLYAVETPSWLLDYDFSLDSDDETIELHSYKGGDSDLFVPGSAAIRQKELRIIVDSVNNVWGPGVTRLAFGDVKIGRFYAKFLHNAKDLQYLDLGDADFSDVNYGSDMLNNCEKLQTIITPVGLSFNVPLQRVFVDGDGNTYTSIPENLTESIELQAASVSEWLEDYSYELSGDTIVLKKYFGSAANVVVPASAVIGDNTYNRIQITPGVWSSSSVVSLSFEGTVDFTGSAYRMFDHMEQLEYLDLSNQTGTINDASYMFGSCSRLQSLDLSGFDLSGYELDSGMFSGCDALQTIKTPVNVNCEIKLPGIYADVEGNIYSFLPRGQGSSITLTRVTDMSEWLSDYEFYTESGRIFLSKYTGNSETVTVPGSAVIGGKELSISVSDMYDWETGIWGDADVKQMTFGNGVIMPGVCRKLFANLSITSIDLSEADFSETIDMSDMFTGCRNLNTIITPKNITLDANLPAAFEDANGNTYSLLPKNLNNTFTVNFQNN